MGFGRWLHGEDIPADQVMPQSVDFGALIPDPAGILDLPRGLAPNELASPGS